MIIKVPFKFWGVIFEKDIEFLFRIATLESASLDILKCELHELDEQDANKMQVAVLYAAYSLACEKKRRIKKYDLSHAIYWAEHMSKTSHDQFLKAIQELIGKMSKVSEKKKK
jgi:hypothetical protein